MIDRTSDDNIPDHRVPDILARAAVLIYDNPIVVQAPDNVEAAGTEVPADSAVVVTRSVVVE